MIDLYRLIVDDTITTDKFYIIPLQEEDITLDPSRARIIKPFPTRLRIYLRKYIQEIELQKGFKYPLRGHVVMGPRFLEELRAAANGNANPENS